MEIINKELVVKGKGPSGQELTAKAPLRIAIGNPTLGQKVKVKTGTKVGQPGLREIRQS
jgi:hypothetical protein